MRIAAGRIHGRGTDRMPVPRARIDPERALDGLRHDSDFGQIVVAPRHSA